jgi:hypothetical protein
MGLFSKRGAQPAATDGWQTDSSGVLGHLDNASLGDAHSGQSYSFRLMNPAMPGRFITITYYPVQYESWQSPEWGVERKVEWWITDPSFTDSIRQWEDSETDLVNPTALGTREEAERMAVQFANEDAADPAEYGTWDGQPEGGN